MLGTHAVPRYINSLLISLRSALEAKKNNALLRDSACQFVRTYVSSLKLLKRISIKFNICRLTLNVFGRI